jgi:hypothetical protein
MSLLDTRSATSTETALEPGATRASEAPHGAPPPLALDGPDSSNLKLVLIMIDVVAASSAWLLWAAFADVKPDAYLSGPLRAAVLAVALTLLSLGGFRLYRARVCSVHAVEIAGIGKASAIAAIGVQAFEGAIGVDTEPLHLAAGAVAVFLALLTGRRGFRTWIARRRRRGQHLRPVVVVGTNDEGRALVAMLRRNPRRWVRRRRPPRRPPWRREHRHRALARPGPRDR